MVAEEPICADFFPRPGGVHKLVKMRGISGAVGWKLYLDCDIEAGVPAFDLVSGIFIAELSDHLTHSRRVLDESGAELALGVPRAAFA